MKLFLSITTGLFVFPLLVSAGGLTPITLESVQADGKLAAATAKKNEKFAEPDAAGKAHLMKMKDMTENGYMVDYKDSNGDTKQRREYYQPNATERQQLAAMKLAGQLQNSDSSIDINAAVKENSGTAAGGMVHNLMVKFDANKDGTLSPEEVGALQQYMLNVANISKQEQAQEKAARQHRGMSVKEQAQAARQNR